MDAFVQVHKGQLDMLNIPAPLVQGLRDQLEAAIGVEQNNQGEKFLDVERMAFFLQQRSILARPDSVSPADYGSMLVIPHLAHFNVLQSNHYISALDDLETPVLHQIWQGLQKVTQDDNTSKNLVNDVAGHAAFWSRVILYRNGTIVEGAIPSPPYLPHCAPGEEADCTGPFPFKYLHPILGCVDLSLVYISPEALVQLQLGKISLPSIDLVPSYQCPDMKLRHVRYAALLHRTDDADSEAEANVKEIHANFVLGMHLVRQAALEQKELQKTRDRSEPNDIPQGKVYGIYTDTNDPMELKHPVAGIESNSSRFRMVDSIDEADCVYSYSSAFSPKSAVRERMLKTPELLVNQFPFEGAFVQKDHLAREVLKQHGLPRPPWSLETYDLDTHLAEFMGAAISEPGLWIVKPAAGTQSKGHVVTRSLAHILRLVDASSSSRVAQRYIEDPVSVNFRKVDCRCVVILTDAGDKDSLPRLYMHNNVYFRIANKKHAIATASDLADHESVLTATHLFTADKRSTVDELKKLPVDVETIAHLEATYKDAFQWNDAILPKIHSMVRELFNGMTSAYPAMGESKQSRALYGVDVMFEIDDSDEGSPCITPKLTEVTFCPSNNAVCEAYNVQAGNVELYTYYNKDILECMFLDKPSERITRLQ